ncbi:MAG: hypothetical protein NC411_08630 [Bacteroides sp.]|nr:hypothetical protein [Bacteroides sp.]
MEDDKIRELFSNFEPDMTSDFTFMTKLQRNMNAVEIVKEHNQALRRRSRTAVVVAAIAGLLTGVIMTLLFPLIIDQISDINISIPMIGLKLSKVDCRLVAWIVMATASCLMSLNVYEMMMVRKKIPS